MSDYGMEFTLAKDQLRELRDRGLAGGLDAPTNGLMVLSRLNSCSLLMLGAGLIDPRKWGEVSFPSSFTARMK